jgi:cytochrome c biogenesis protein CcdA
MIKKVDLTREMDEIAEQTGSLARTYAIAAGLCFAIAVLLAILAIRTKIEPQASIEIIGSTVLFFMGFVVIGVIVKPIIYILLITNRQD